MNFLYKVPSYATHYHTGLTHATIERFNDKVRQHLRDYVIAKQEEIVLNDSTSWVDIEVDEVTISKYHTKSKTQPVAWVQYLGIIRRGHPESLILVPMPVRQTGLRAPGPGPLLLKVWEKISKQYITKNKRLIIHTDAARAYRKPIDGTLHTAIMHQMKKIDGVWVKPQFTRREDLELPDGTILTVRAGTQFVDGLWCVIKREIKNSRRNSNPDLVDKLIRVVQWRYWNQAKDLYAAMSETMPWCKH